MKRTPILVAAGVVLLAGGASAFYLHHRGAKKSAPVHAKAETRGSHEVFPTVKAMLDAPAGKTPCESAFLAFTAEHERAKEMGRVSMFIRIAPRDEFLAGCAKLTPEQQQCLVPSYRMSHDAECVKVKPAREALSFVELVHEQQEEDEPTLQKAPGAVEGPTSDNPG